MKRWPRLPAPAPQQSPCPASRRHTLGWSVAGRFGIGRIGKQHQHSLPAQLGQPGKSGRLASYRGIIQFEITRMYQYAYRRLIISPAASGMLWQTGKNSTRKFPRFTFSPKATTFSLAPADALRSFSFTSISPTVSFVPKIGAFNCGSRYGNARCGLSWPW